MFRFILELIMLFIICYLFYSIITGAFCHCSSVQCPNSLPLRSYLA